MASIARYGVLLVGLSLGPAGCASDQPGGAQGGAAGKAGSGGVSGSASGGVQNGGKGNGGSAGSEGGDASGGRAGEGGSNAGGASSGGAPQPGGAGGALLGGTAGTVGDGGTSMGGASLGGTAGALGDGGSSNGGAAFGGTAGALGDGGASSGGASLGGSAGNLGDGGANMGGSAPIAGGGGSGGNNLGGAGNGGTASGGAGAGGTRQCFDPWKPSYNVSLNGTFDSQSLDPVSCNVASFTQTGATINVQPYSDSTKAVITLQYGLGVAFLGQIASVVTTDQACQLSISGVCSSSPANNFGWLNLTIDRVTGVTTVSGTCGPVGIPLSCAAPRTRVAGQFSAVGAWWPCSPNPTPTTCSAKAEPVFCDAGGTWRSQAACSGAAPVCVNGACVAGSI